MWTKTLREDKNNNNSKKRLSFKGTSEFEISHSSFAEDSGLLGCDTLPLREWFPTVRNIIVPLSSRLNQKVEVGTTILRHAGNHSLKHTASHPRTVGY
jgi:hypothetical protein